MYEYISKLSYVRIQKVVFTRHFIDFLKYRFEYFRKILFQKYFYIYCVVEYFILPRMT